MRWYGKEAAFLCSKTQISGFYSPLVSQIPGSFWGCSLISSIFQLRLLALCHVLQKLHWPRGQAGNDCAWKGCPAGTGDLVMPLPWTGKRLRAGAPGSRGCRVLYPILLPFGNPLPCISVPVLAGVSVKILGSRHSQENPAIKFLASLNLLNHLPGGCFLLLCSTNTSNH